VHSSAVLTYRLKARLFEVCIGTILHIIEAQPHFQKVVGSGPQAPWLRRHCNEPRLEHRSVLCSAVFRTVVLPGTIYLHRVALALLLYPTFGMRRLISKRPKFHMGRVKAKSGVHPVSGILSISSRLTPEPRRRHFFGWLRSNPAGAP